MHVTLHGFSLQILDYTSFERKCEEVYNKTIVGFLHSPFNSLLSITAFAYSCFGTYLVKKKNNYETETI